MIERDLQQRLGEKRGQMILLVIALVLVFLAIVYLYGGFYVSTRSSLKALGQVMGRMADGDMTVTFRVQSQDELGELGQAVNDAVGKIHQLIREVGDTVSKVGAPGCAGRAGFRPEQPGGGRAAWADRAVATAGAGHTSMGKCLTLAIRN